VEWVTTSTILRDLRDYANATAWSSFVGRFRDPIVRFAVGLGVPGAQAQDVAQETLAAFAESMRTGRYERERGRLRSWLFGIAYKHVLKERDRGRRREEPIGGDAEIEAALASTPDEKTAADTWNHHWEQFVLRESLAQVRREFRPESVTAFERVARDDRPPQEVADELGLPVKAVYNAKHRILKRLRELRADFEESLPDDAVS
jgi:RNA polymerase sigma-70 factor (ECF subfamily)